MKVSVEAINTVQSRVSLEIPAPEVDKAFLDALKRIQKKARVQGFRPGKAPLNMIKKLYGEHVSGEVGEKLIQGTLFTALNENNIQPIASPVVDAREAPAQGKEFKFSAVVDTLPALAFDDYKNLPVTTPSYSVPESVVEREIKTLRRRAAEAKDVEGNPPAKEGHLVTISHTATVDGRPLPQMSMSDMTVALGEGEIFKGLEDAVMGMTKGETKTAPVKLPEQFIDAEAAGKTAEFTITLTELKDLVIPELSDEFAKDLNFDSVDALKADVRKHLEGQAAHLERQNIEGAILTALLSKHPFEVPPAMVDQVIDSMVSELPHKDDEARKAALHDRELRERFREEAIRRTQNTLILWHVSKKENIVVTDEDVAKKIDTTLRGFGMPDGDSPQRARLAKQIEPRLRENLIFEKAMDFLVENAQVTREEKPLGD